MQINEFTELVVNLFLPFLISEFLLIDLKILLMSLDTAVANRKTEIQIVHVIITKKLSHIANIHCIIIAIKYPVGQCQLYGCLYLKEMKKNEQMHTPFENFRNFKIHTTRELVIQMHCYQNRRQSI